MSMFCHKADYDHDHIGCWMFIIHSSLNPLSAIAYRILSTDSVDNPVFNSVKEYVWCGMQR